MTRRIPLAVRLLAVAALAVSVLALARPAGAEPKRIRLSITDFAAASASEAGALTLGRSAGGREQLRAWVQEWRQGVEEGNEAEAADLLPRIKELLALEGAREKESILGAFTALGTDWTLAENWPAAELAFAAALQLDPDNSAALLGKARMTWRKETGPKRFIGALAGVAKATQVRLSHALGLLQALANIGLVLCVALMITIGGFAVVMLAKYNRLLRHGAIEAMQDRVPEGIDRALAWVVVFLPVLLFLTPPYWVVYWLVALRGFGTAAEKRMSLVALLVVAVLPVLFHVVSVTSSLQQDPVLRAISGLKRGDVSTDVLEDVANVRNLRDMPEAKFLVARLYEAAQRSEDAINTYTELADSWPRDTRSLVNRGNIHFRRGDHASAIADYKKAEDQDPKNALAMRNASVAYSQMLQTPESAAWMAKANKVDREGVRRWSEVGPDVVVDAEMRRDEGFKILLKEHEDFLPGLGRRVLNPVTVVALLGFIACFVLGRKEPSLLQSAACQKCGRAFCARCHAAAKASSYCTQCTHLYVKKDGVSPVVRTAKMREVERWVAINSLAVRFFNLAIPGAGSIYANRVSSGALLLLLWALAVAMLAGPTRARMVVDPTRLGDIDLAVFFGLQVALLLIVYLVTILQSLRHQD